MKAVVFHGIGDIRLDDVPEPTIRDRTDAIIRVTASAICGTDLHLVRGTVPGMRPGTVLGHEAVGIVEEIGKAVRNLREGDRVIVPSTIACGFCAYCRAGYFSQCDTVNPHGPRAGTAFFGGPESSGAFDGLQAERARIPYANVGLVKVPEDVADEEAVLLSDIFPTAYFGAALAEIRPGDTVAVFGCGPVGQLAITSARLFDAGRILAVDTIPERLEMARAQGAEVMDFNAEDPVEVIRELTGGIGVDRVIDAVGVDAQHPDRGPAATDADGRAEFAHELDEAAPEQNPHAGTWVPGDAPSQATRWAVEMVAKAGTIGTVGVYPPQVEHYPFGAAFMKNLTLKMGNCNHRRYVPELVSLVANGTLDPTPLITRWSPTEDAIEAYQSFDRRETGWTKVALGLGGPGAVPPGSGHASGTGATTTAGTAAG
jgi:threonine dehydrogenase-like Zn-dependent dehydrogenase